MSNIEKLLLDLNIDHESLINKKSYDIDLTKEVNLLLNKYGPEVAYLLADKLKEVALNDCYQAMKNLEL